MLRTRRFSKMKSLVLILVTIFTIGTCGIIIFYIITSNPDQSDTFPKAKARIKEISWDVELAQTIPERARGLSGRKSLDQNSGMLFIISKPARELFWMKGMNFPLDIIWIRHGKVVDITQNAQPLKNNFKPILYKPKEPIDMVLEINAGQADQYGIQIGDKVDIITKY